MRPDLRCYYHPKREATSQCDLCGDMLCRFCVREHEGLHICKTCKKRIMQGGPTTYVNRWSLVVAVLYGLILAVLAGPLIMLAFIGERLNIGDILDMYIVPQFWIYPGVMVICQVAMLVVPVRVSSRRPVSRRTILAPMIVSGLLMGALAFGGVLSMGEFIEAELPGEDFGWLALLAGLGLWVFWTLLFFNLSEGKDPRNVIAKLCRRMLVGSILELLIAVPTHVVARYRNYCCAGFMTFVGIAFGLSVMLFSFGPGVFFLYVARWRRLHPNRPPNPSEPESNTPEHA